MALHLKKDFAALCNLKTKDLSNYIKRKKVVMSGDYVDDSLAINKDFLRRRNGGDKKHEVEKVLEISAPKVDQPAAPNVKKPADFNANGGTYELEKHQKALSIEKMQEEIELLQIKKEKQLGLVIPTPLVKLLFTQHSKSIVSSFHNATDTLLMKIQKMKGLSSVEMASLRGELTEIINIAVDDSIKESKKQIKNIVTEYSEKKGVGERA